MIKRFQPHLNNVSRPTLPFETLNAHYTRADFELLQKETPECTPPPAASKFATFEPG